MPFATCDTEIIVRQASKCDVRSAQSRYFCTKRPCANFLNFPVFIFPFATQYALNPLHSVADRVTFVAGAACRFNIIISMLAVEVGLQSRLQAC